MRPAATALAATLLAFSAIMPLDAQAKPSYQDAFFAQYPNARTSLPNCTGCHEGPAHRTRNAFANAFAANGHAFNAALEAKDSDGDGVTNGDELTANPATDPSDPRSRPAVTPPAANYQGLFWNAPAGSESGWGINVAHQGDVIFATWFTYEPSGKALWLSMTAAKTAEGIYTGTLYQTRGPAFRAMPFNPAAVTRTEVGTGTLTFTDADNGSFAYAAFGVVQTKAITRQVFAPLPTCTFGAQPDLANATNYQDLWYAAPADSEAGWGVNLTHQGDIIFATWFTYDADGTALWLSATAARTAPEVYTGTVYRTTGPAFNAAPFLPASVTLANVGTLTLTFANGNSADYTYTLALDGPASAVTQTKAITRQVFRAPGTMCR